MIIHLGKYGSSLGTRQQASEIRNEILNNIPSNDTCCVIDCEGLQVMSNSFADELVGIMVQKIGYSEMSKTIHFKNASIDIKKSIKKAIVMRLNSFADE